LRDCFVYLYWNVLQDVILLESLKKLKERDQLGIAYFIVERLCLQTSFIEALAITGDDEGLMGFTNTVMTRKFHQTQEEDVAEVAPFRSATLTDGRSPRANSRSPINVLGYSILPQSNDSNGHDFSYESPMFDSEEELEAVDLFYACHGQVNSFVLKCIAF
jgi:hypothetical protein